MDAPPDVVGGAIGGGVAAALWALTATIREWLSRDKAPAKAGKDNEPDPVLEEIKALRTDMRELCHQLELRDVQAAARLTALIDAMDRQADMINRLIERLTVAPTLAIHGGGGGGSGSRGGAGKSA